MRARTYLSNPVLARDMTVTYAVRTSRASAGAGSRSQSQRASSRSRSTSAIPTGSGMAEVERDRLDARWLWLLLPAPALAREVRTAYVTVMSRAKTGFDKYVRARMEDPEFASAYKEALVEIDAIDRLMRRIDVARARAGLSKADLARRASAPQESVRRLLTAKKSNPTLQTVVRLAQAVGLRVELVAESAPGRRRRAAAHA